MFKLHNKLLFSNYCKCETSKSLFLSVILRKSTLAVPNNEHKVKETIFNCHDALDVFTNTLILENTIKWKTDNFLPLNKSLNVKLKSNAILKSYDDPDNLMTYLQQCLDGHCKVNEEVLQQSMLTLSRHGKIGGLILIKRLNEKYHYCIKENELQMNFAEAYWTNGSLNKMFDIFDTFYLQESVKVNCILESIICTIVKSRGFASLVKVSNFVNTIVVKHEDYHPMCILWKYLFLSELYNDNLEAEKLLRKNSNLIKHILYIVPTITNNMLKQHKTDYVQRLMMIMLKQNRMESYQWILRSFFEYYCKYYLGIYINL